MKEAIKRIWTKTEQARIALFFLLVIIAYIVSFVNCLIDKDFADYMREHLSIMWGENVNLWACNTIGLIFVLGLLYFAIIDPLIERHRDKQREAKGGHEILCKKV